MSRLFIGTVETLFDLSDDDNENTSESENNSYGSELNDGNDALFHEAAMQAATRGNNSDANELNDGNDALFHEAYTEMIVESVARGHENELNDGHDELFHD